MMRAILLALAGLLLPCLLLAQVAAVHLTLHVPPTTDTSQQVYVTGSFNHWYAGDALYKMHKTGASTYAITLPVYKGVAYQYKYTRGKWSEVETALNDSDVANRAFLVQAKSKKLVDTVVNWKKPPRQASAQTNLILQRKDSLVESLKSKLAGMLPLLEAYTLNLLQEVPGSEEEKQITEKVVGHFAEVFGLVNQFCHDILGRLSPAQKQKLRKALENRDQKKDFINALMAAMNDVMSDKVPVKN